MKNEMRTFEQKKVKTFKQGPLKMIPILKVTLILFNTCTVDADNGINRLMESDLSRFKSPKLLCHALCMLKLIHLLVLFG
jgi:hypothetical protein